MPEQIVEQLINGLLQLSASLILAIVGFAVTRLMALLKIKQDAAARAAFDDVLLKSVTFGLQQTRGLIRERGWDDDMVRSEALRQALPYLERFPDVLKALKIDGSRRDVLQGKFADALDRAFPVAAEIAARSPGTPPATAPMPARQADLPALGMEPG